MPSPPAVTRARGALWTTALAIAAAIGCALPPSEDAATEEIDCDDAQYRDTEPECWPASRELSGAFESFE